MQHAKILIQQCLTAQELPKPKAPTVAPTSAKPRQTLTERQRAFPLLRKASERITLEVGNRAGKYLRRLDSIHASGSRTHQQRWNALGILKDLMLARMDLATLALGWVDQKGELHLNRQCGLVQDSDLSPSCVSRTLKALEWATYLERKIARRFEQGKGWVTSIAIFFTRRFFIDLGLGLELDRVLKRKQKQRAQQLQEAESKRQQQKLTADAGAHIRKESHLKAQGRLRNQKADQATSERAAIIRQRTDVALDLRDRHPELTDQEIRDWVNQKYPLP